MAKPQRVHHLAPALASSLDKVEPTIDQSGLRLFPWQVVTDDGVLHTRVDLVEVGVRIRGWRLALLQSRAKIFPQ